MNDVAQIIFYMNDVTQLNFLILEVSNTLLLFPFTAKCEDTKKLLDTFTKPLPSLPTPVCEHGGCKNFTLKQAKTICGETYIYHDALIRREYSFTGIESTKCSIGKDPAPL